MCIVKLNGNIISKIINCSMNCLMLSYNVRKRRTAEEVLLLQTKLLSLVCVVIRIEYTGYILGKNLFL